MLHIQQGSILKCDLFGRDDKQILLAHRAVEAKRSATIKDGHFLIVLSQDCDIANENERYVEVILAKKKSKPHASVTKTCSTRKLQLPVQKDWLEMDVDNISMVPKSVLFDKLPCDQLIDKNKSILLTWRINRYTRSPLPHGFNQAFLNNYLKAPGNELAKFLERYHEEITDLYVYVEPNDDEAERFLFSLTVLLKRTANVEADGDFQQLVDSTIEEALQELHTADNGLHCIQIDNPLTEAVNFTLDLSAFPQDFTFEDVLYLKRLTVDYLCFSDDDG